MTEIKNGDTVRLTFVGKWLEGAVDVHPYRFGGRFLDVGTVEKIEPPVETFKPGDVVRAKHNPGLIVALHKGGYTYIGSTNQGTQVTYYGRRSGFDPEHFTSKDFEKVPLE